MRTFQLKCLQLSRQESAGDIKPDRYGTGHRYGPFCHPRRQPGRPLTLPLTEVKLCNKNERAALHGSKTTLPNFKVSGHPANDDLGDPNTHTYRLLETMIPWGCPKVDRNE